MFNITREIIRAFKRGIFPYIDGVKVDEESDKELDENNFLKVLRMNQKVLTMSCLKNILNLQYQLSWQKHYLKQKIKKNKKNDVLVNVINSALKDLKEEITNMSEGEKNPKTR